MRVSRGRARSARLVEGRANDIPGITLPTWDEVQRMRAEYEPRTDDRLVIDGTAAMAGNVARVREYVGR